MDGSTSSMSAVRAAAGLASMYGLPLQVVHTFNWLPNTPEHDDTDPGTAANALLQHAVTAAQNVSPRLAISVRLLEGAPSPTLLRQAHTAALLAIGDGGLSSHVCLPTHTSAVHIAACASCSVLVARAKHLSEGSIVVGVNGSPASERALDFAFDTAARSGADLVVVRVGTPAPEVDDKTDDQLRHLADLVDVREAKYRIAARTRVLPGDPAAALVAESKQAGVVIIGARGQQPYGGLLGSAAQTLLHHSSAPLILVRGLMMPRPDGSGARPDIGGGQLMHR
ncbi:universal stress protein [Actinoplanes sp. ATCC 53533]|uniref:universal stress protein n=1 Tax=Actinoplanes sp. ATCC 53533 TaxID=1288362 RepID=UPI00210569F1|nr:universal stress protein [Actinoplanes sp. ATCC 53533]